MHPPVTYELRVVFNGAPAVVQKQKSRLIDWLLFNGVDAFVEGSLDCDINQNQDEPPRDHFSELGGELTPVSIYRYTRESLEDLKAKLGRDFKPSETGIETSLVEHSTEEWMEGWKSSFLPFATPEFRVRPPWVSATAGEGESEAARKKGLIDLVIEPGMAFGTGQHATTRLCLEALGRIAAKHGRPADRAKRTVLDVGTGTGILMIGASLLGYGVCAGTDIEDDAVLAAAENAKMNKTPVAVKLGSIPEAGKYDLVFANILAVTLLRLMDELVGVMAGGGYLVLSGLLVEEQKEIEERARGAGLRIVEATQQDGWSCVVAQLQA
jgi:ribosomal protein L11 methyltransferase